MKSIPKLIRRFFGILLMSVLLIFILNIGMLFIFASGQTVSRSPWTTAIEVAEALQKSGDGYQLSDASVLEELERDQVWGILIDDTTHQVIWHTDNLPEEIPMEYSLGDIAMLTRGYVKDYPTFPGRAEEGLVVLGYPKDRYWKEMWPSWDYDMIKYLPRTILVALTANVVLIFLIYLVTNARLLHFIGPIIEGIQKLPEEQKVYIKEKGLLSELAMNINRTSEIIQSQKQELKKKERARANWIAGVSHDIRTPLSMVMGYAGQLAEDGRLTEEEQKKAVVIVKQSEKMRNLIRDLNLASKLEYNMQPLKTQKENIVALVRKVMVDFMNLNIEDKYDLEWETEDSLTSCMITVDGELLKRAVTNLIQNSMNHNPEGCGIFVSVKMEPEACCIMVEDDGAGVEEEQIRYLNHAPHYMVCDDNTSEQKHGLGLLIVKQIADAHQGKVEIDKGDRGGFRVQIILPYEAE
ncbi:MAG: HAMP domain-containing histidine kinase [Lachnospiraceae bacterium]|nr:HAMP domain-containing histidine kinase [Lachnospiraceae bacterium]